MTPIANILTYTLLFIVAYFNVFLLLTLFDHNERRHSARQKGQRLWNEPHDNEEIHIDPKRTYPTVTIIVPIWNEEKTVESTIESLLQLEYPKDKLEITVVDDGSKDNTWQIIQKYKDNPQITLYQKENGGKYTALNYGITHSKNEFIGCLDADSFVDSKALLHMIPYFDNAEIMAVTPSMKIKDPDCILGLMQSAEYDKGIFTRKVFSLLDAQYVTPGPFSIFRKKVFESVGLYKHAHNTEDLEMALRLQEKHFRMVNADRALVYTVGPRTLYKLYRQRVRWTGGFIQNALDYKKMILNPQYGNFGMLILPMAMLGIVVGVFIFFFAIYRMIKAIISSYQHANLIGWDFSNFNFSLETFAYHLKAPLFIGVIMLASLIFTIWYGKKVTGTTDRKVIDIICYLLVFSLVSPFWLLKSVFNTLRKRDASWR